ncbi:NAD(P)-dependent oxidoreductase [Ktedonosporobacter rubrisoli]|uniref:NAD(P)-dependent oxidoreductase n=1 Tax=Ktedonosporobacter rubrisoli TaxID=2509675 RepID=A0A4P6JT99_KTERU|nr:NAD(P)-dependent oxidoreductase [Ktedonosporobacter rubrisoli]QBD78523.1 NAD(P)-dependent oxidoreductase [Ktedonosporobacter rubrisoli]
MNMAVALEQRQRENRPIRVGLVGVGQMGAGLIAQIGEMNGMDVVAAADIDLPRAVGAFRAIGVLEDDIVVLPAEATAEQASEAVAAGKRVVTSHAALIPDIAIDAVVEATGMPSIGAVIAYRSILARRHIIMLNVETDVTVGYLLKRMADAANVVYTTAAGDEPGAILELYDFARTLGFEIIAAGKGKNNQLDRSATPQQVAEKAAQQEMSPKMLASFVDGTKTMVEMTAVANATGLVPDVSGMHGPQATPETLAQIFCPKEDGGVLEHTGVVDYALGNVAPGVFLIFTTHQPKVVKDLQYLKLGNGPYWALYRPYHLANIETPRSVALAVLYNQTTLAPKGPPVAETTTVAKRDLQVGDILDGLGGTMVHGNIERADVARAEKMLPLGLSERARVIRPVSRGQTLTYADVELDDQSFIVHARRLQDLLVE